MKITKSLLAFLALTLLPAAALAAESAVAVMYHRFGEEGLPSTNIRLDQFDAHIAELTSGKYTVLPLPEIIAKLKAGDPLPDRTVAITIDDAAKSVYTEAWPRLRAANLPFTLFLATAEVGGGSFMTWDEVRELAAGGVTIGSQAHTHPHMAGLTAADVAQEIENSAKRIEEEIGVAPTLFAWPYGETSSEAINILKEKGFDAAFGQHSGAMDTASGLFYLARFPMNENYGDMIRFKQAVNALSMFASDVLPADPKLSVNPPPFGFTVNGGIDDLSRLNCYASHEGRVAVEKLGPRVEARLNSPFPQGRGRINCTLPEGNRWRWFGWQYVIE